MKRGRGKYSYITARIDCGRSPRPCSSSITRHESEDKKASHVLEQQLIEQHSDDKIKSTESSDQESNEPEITLTEKDITNSQSLDKSALRKSITAFEEQLDAIRARYETRIHVLTTTHEAEVQELKTAQLETEIVVERKEAEIANLQRELECSSLARQGLLQIFDELSQTHNADVEELSVSLKKLAKQNQELDIQNAALNHKVKQIQFIADSNWIEANTKQLSVNKLQNEIKHMKAGYDKLLGDNEELNKKLQILTAETENITYDTKEVTADFESLFPEIICRNVESQTDFEITQGVGVATAVTPGGENPSTSDGHENAMLKQQQLEEILNQHLLRIEALQNSIQEQRSLLRSVKMEHRKELRQLNTRLCEKDEELSKLKVDLEREKRLAGSVQESARMIMKLEQEVTEAKNKIESKSREIELQHITNVRLKEAALIFEEMLNDTEDKFAKKCSEAEDLRIKCEGMESSIKQLKLQTQEIDNCRRAKDEVVAINQNLDLQIRKLMSEGAHTELKVENLDKQICQLTETNLYLSQKIASLKEKLVSLRTEYDATLVSVKTEYEASLATFSGSYDRLQTNFSNAFTEKCLAEAKADRLLTELETAKADAKVQYDQLHEAVAHANIEHQRTKTMAAEKEREARQCVVDLSNICDGLRREVESLSDKPKKSLRHLLFGGGSDKTPKEGQQTPTSSRPMKEFTSLNYQCDIDEPYDSTQKHDGIRTALQKGKENQLLKRAHHGDMKTVKDPSNFSTNPKSVEVRGHDSPPKH